jgi:uncharacterized membrane protein YphA (DoxX/SURF4 family)
MSSITVPLKRRAAGGAAPVSARSESWRDPRFQAYLLLRIGFAAAPVLFGLDKFLNVMVDWPQYLAPWLNDIVPGSGQDFMYVTGAVEILAGLAVAVKPRYGAYLVAGWLAGIIVNLLSYSGWYDIALRDFGLLLGALALARLASTYDRPLRRVGS